MYVQRVSERLDPQDQMNAKISTSVFIIQTYVARVENVEIRKVADWHLNTITFG